MLTFSGLGEVDAGQSRPVGPSIDDLFPSTRELRPSAREVLRRSVFARTASGYRFRQHHVQEWFTAFALVGLPPTRVRPYLASTDGSPLSQHQGVHGILRQIGEQPLADAISHLYGGIPPRSDASGWTLVDAAACMDGLQANARSSPYGIRLDDNALHAFRTPAIAGLGQLLSERLADDTLGDPECRVVIDVASAVKATDTAPPAAQIVRNPRRSDDLRVMAAYLLVKVGSDDELRGIAEYVRRCNIGTERRRAMKSVILRELYERGLWEFDDIVRHLPEKQDDVGDATAFLGYSLKRELTADRARRVLHTCPDVMASLTSPDDSSLERPHLREGRRQVVLTSIKVLLEADDMLEEDYELLLPLALAGRTSHRLGLDEALYINAFARNRNARRQLFVAGLDRDPDDADPNRWVWKSALTGDDVEWLCALAMQCSAESPWLLRHLLQLLYQQGVSQATRNRVRRTVRNGHAAILSQFDADLHKSRQRERRFEAERETARATREAAMLSLEHLARDTLAHPEMGPVAQMRRLSSLCLGAASRRWTNVSGGWTDLPDSLRADVTEVIREGLDECTPTAIPEGDTFYSDNVYEADAFVHVINHLHDWQLTAAHIRAWLPAVLRVALPADEHTLSICFDFDRRVAEEVFVNELRRSMSSASDRIHVAEHLPAELWSEQLLTQAHKLVQDESLGLEARIRLLRLLVQRSPDHAAPSVESWINLPGTMSGVVRKREAALDAMLIVDPVEAMSRLKAGLETGGVNLESLTSLTDRRQSWHVDLRDWPTESIAALADLLYRQYPPDTDPTRPSGVGYSPGPDDELRELRATLVPLIFERGGDSDLSAIETLANEHQSIADWYAYARANAEATQVLGALRSRHDSEAIPVDQVVRSLEDAKYRLIRSEDDLQSVIWDELSQITSDARHHLSMLYRSPDRRGADSKRTRQHEDALQAYLDCRLNDRLPGRVLDESTVVILNRETVEAANRRFDIKIQAPVIGGRLATLVVEVKWSDNDDVSTAIVEQLGTRYLVEEQLTHGLYVVGWCRAGCWKSRARGTPPKSPRTIVTWREALDNQAAAYSAQAHVSIKVVVLDLRWDPSP